MPAPALPTIERLRSTRVPTPAPPKHRRQQRLAWVCLLLAAAIPVAAQRAKATPPANDWLVVIPIANMYSAPTESADVVSQAILGSEVAVLKVRGEWARVRTSDQFAGWMPASKLRKVLDPNFSQKQFVTVESLFANVYRESDVAKHRPVLTVPFESRLEFVAEGTGKAADWLQVRLPDQRDVWIQRGDVTRDPKPLAIEESIEFAKRFLGLPFLWGGSSSYGFDSAGLTQMLLRRRGVNMPRDAGQQAAWKGLTPVDRKDLRAGDLLFFGSGKNKITNTGVYIGDGLLIQATTQGHPVVQINRLDDEPWTRLLVGCKRVR